MTPYAPPQQTAARFDLTPLVRGLIALAGAAMTVAAFFALTRGLAGWAPDHASARKLAVIVHLSAVLPAIPLGAWLLLSRKGTPLHRTLGKAWLGMMIVTALSAIFIRSGGSFSWIHLFVPLTLVGAWQVYSTARSGAIAKHRGHIVQMYLGALMIPGFFAFVGGRLMGVWLLG